MNIVTQNICNPLELQQNMWNHKSLFTRIFIHYKAFTLGEKKKLNTCSERPYFANGCFCKDAL